jgi:two-component system response regulator RstA
VEDDIRLCEMMAEMLRDEFYQVTCVYDGLSAISSITTIQPDIVLLDMNIPGCNGLEVLRKINGNFFGIILMITAENDDFLEVSALNLGVHDYLMKPIRPHVLLAKLRALYRLTQQQALINDNLIRIQDLTINVNTRTLYLSENLVDVTAAEYEIILYFMNNPATMLSREMIVKEIRNIDYDGLDRSIDMRICSLRKKLDDVTPPYKYIKTVRAKGYILPN